MNEQKSCKYWQSRSGHCQQPHRLYFRQARHGLCQQGCGISAHQGDIGFVPSNRPSVRGRQSGSGHRSGNRWRNPLAVDGAPSLGNHWTRSVRRLRRENGKRRRFYNQARLR